MQYMELSTEEIHCLMELVLIRSAQHLFGVADHIADPVIHGAVKRHRFFRLQGNGTEADASADR